jgi:hypothetical protein
MPRTRKNNVVAMPKADASPSGLAAQPTVTNHDIARRAYEIFECRRGAPGTDLDDWLQAEQELHGKGAAERRA